MSKRTAEHIMRSFMAFCLLLLSISGFDGKQFLEYPFPKEWIGPLKLFILFLVIWLAFGKLKSPRQSIV